MDDQNEVLNRDSERRSDAEILWDGYAESFDESADHGLRDPKVKTAWESLLLPILPKAPCNIIDLGSGTGSLSILLAEQGHLVTGVDVSSKMVGRAKLKAEAAGLDIDFLHGDAAALDFEGGTFDVVLARHVLWVFDDPETVLKRWTDVLRPDGVLILIEGRWTTGAGLTSEECVNLVLRNRSEAALHPLSDNGALWGEPVTDDRYLILSRP